MKEEHKVWFRGVNGCGDEVIRTLVALGGRQKHDSHLTGNRSDVIYVIDHDGYIGGVYITNETAKIIMDNYREIKLHGQWVNGDILVENCSGKVYSVFRHANSNGKFWDYLCVNDDAIIIANVFRSASKWHLANEEEKKTFTNLLHKHHKEWDAEKKQLVDWRWKPKEKEIYWLILSDGHISNVFFKNDEYDNNAYNFGNCFRTREEALAMVEKIKKLLNTKS